MPTNPLRNLPSINDLLESPQLRGVLGRISHNTVVSRARMVLDEVLSEVQTAASDVTLPSVTELAERIVHRLRDDPSSTERPAINATGVILHPELGSPPPAEVALVEATAAVSGYTAPINTTDDASRAGQAAKLLIQLTSAEAALVTNSYASARMLAFAACAASREVVIPRAHLAETQSGLRIEQGIRLAGARVKEVGAANAIHSDDYRQAISEETGLICHAPPSDHAVTGHGQQLPLADVVRLGRELRRIVMNDLGRAVLQPLPGVKASAFPVVTDAVRSGADLVVFEGDLLGGPRCGVVLGRRELVQQLERHPLFAALGAGRFCQALLAGTLRLYQQPDVARREIPLLQLLDTPVENLKLRAHRLAEQMATGHGIATAKPTPGVTYVTGASVPAQQLETWCIELTARAATPESLAQSLQSGIPAVVSRVMPDRLLIDLRTVLPRQDQELVRAVTAMERDPAAPRD